MNPKYGNRIASWNWGLNPSNVAFVQGTLALNSGFVAEGKIANMYVSTHDREGIDRSEEIKSIASLPYPSVLTLDSKPPSADSHWDLQFTVSGVPYFSTEYNGASVIPHYVVPVTLTKIIPQAGGVNWDNTPGEKVDLYEIVSVASPPAVSFTTTGLDVDWDASSYPSQSRRYPTREGWIRKEIYRLTQAETTISHMYKDSLRGMIASFNDVGYINSEEKFIDIKCIHANAERAIAKLKQENNIILPILSISQTTSDNDDERRRNESVLLNEKWWDADKQRAYRVLSLSPRPVNVNYQLNIWCKYMADMDQILEQVRLKFNPEMQVPTHFSTLAKAFIFSEDDVTPVTAADKEDRVIKKSINLVLRTYIPSPKFLITSTGKITRFKVETS